MAHHDQFGLSLQTPVGTQLGDDEAVHGTSSGYTEPRPGTLIPVSTVASIELAPRDFDLPQRQVRKSVLNEERK